MRLREIVWVSFCYSEQTMFAQYRQKNGARVKTFSPDDVVLFISRTGTQMKFVWNWDRLEVLKEGAMMPVKILTSANYRIEGGTWDPLMLGEYAHFAGVGLDGDWIKRFKEAFDAYHG